MTAAAGRCRSLTVIVPAASAVLPAQGPLPDQGRMAKAIIGYIVRSDFLYWLGMTLARDRMIRSLLATDPRCRGCGEPQPNANARSTCSGTSCPSADDRKAF